MEEEIEEIQTGLERQEEIDGIDEADRLLLKFYKFISDASMV
jgi:hypothetical protein